ncbi:NAD(P)/FAD-dependent oxidoreductase [Aquimarina addita]|uniref:NAD(P)/FAD-dependent oxidoreductase n=1 Tax=Aquimarina addita TaxID=870485 RepID=A0ABP7XG81_9FLAO
MAIEEFDVFVIGSGVAGQVAAEACVKEGYSVAIADNREFGGTCANRGCDPKKVILSTTRLINASQYLKGKGISKLPKSSWKDIMKFKSEFTEAVPIKTEEKLKKLNIKMYHQSPKFIDTNTLSVEGKSVKVKKIIIAAGLIPKPLTIKGGSLALLSDDFLELNELPDQIIFIGAGYIGMEFAHMAASLGVDVTVIDSGERPLSIFDKDMVAYIVNASESMGIKFIFNAEVLKIEELRKNKRVHYKVANKKESVKATLVFNTTGRVPSTGSLELDKGNVSHNKEGIEVNEYLQNPKNKMVYACGDIANNTVPLTPFSSKEGKIAAYNLHHGNKKKANFPISPTVAFTLPNIAAVGLSEKEAKATYKHVHVVNKDASSSYNAKRVNEPIYAYKTIVDKSTNIILGAHLVGPEAGEVINLFAMAIYKKMTVQEIKDIIFTYPSWSGDIAYMF